MKRVHRLRRFLMLRVSGEPFLLFVLRGLHVLCIMFHRYRVEPRARAKHKRVIVRVLHGQAPIQVDHVLHQRVRRIRHLLLRAARMEQLAKVKPVSQMVVGREPIRLPLLPQ